MIITVTVLVSTAVLKMRTDWCPEESYWIA